MGVIWLDVGVFGLLVSIVAVELLAIVGLLFDVHHYFWQWDTPPQTVQPAPPAGTTSRVLGSEKSFARHERAISQRGAQFSSRLRSKALAELADLVPALRQKVK